MHTMQSMYYFPIGSLQLTTKCLYKVVEGWNTRPITLLMVPESTSKKFNYFLASRNEFFWAFAPPLYTWLP